MHCRAIAKKMKRNNNKTNYKFDRIRMRRDGFIDKDDDDDDNNDNDTKAYYGENIFIA